MTNGYFQMNVSDIMEGGIKKYLLFLYNLQPPKQNFEYKVCVETNDRKIISTFCVVPVGEIFFQSPLPDLPKGENYCIVLNITDSNTLNKRTVIREILDGK